jgi:universal stress protein A
MAGTPLARRVGMTTTKLKVLVPVDFSETSRLALAWAYDYALRAPCELHLLHVIEDHLADVLPPRPPRDRMGQDIAAVTREAEEELARMVPDGKERAGLGPIVQHVARGPVAQEILRVAEKLDVEMIVMGTHGRTGIAKLMIGSVAEKVVRHAACPVVCVKPGKLRKAA